MAEWIAAIAATLAIAGGFFLFVLGFGKENGASKEWKSSVEERLQRHDNYHKDHYQHAKDDQQHFQDMDLHWTGRERDELYRRLDKQDETAQKILEEVRNLGQRMYDK